MSFEISICNLILNIDNCNINLCCFSNFSVFYVVDQHKICIIVKIKNNISFVAVFVNKDDVHLFSAHWSTYFSEPLFTANRSTTHSRDQPCTFRNRLDEEHLWTPMHYKSFKLDIFANIFLGHSSTHISI